MSSIAGLVGVAIVGVRWRVGVCGGVRKLEFGEGWRECALCGVEWDGESGGSRDSEGSTFLLPGDEGAADGAYIGGGTNDAFTLPGLVEPLPPTSIAACRSLA
jgi:hypothetical protein